MVGAAVAVAVIVIGTLFFRGLQQGGRASGSTGGSTPACSPRPCAAPSGFEADLSTIEVRDGQVSFLVAFKNRTQSTPFEAVSYRHTSPADFQLRSSAGVQQGPTFNSACPQWPELKIERGASAGPERLCFKEPSGGMAGAVVVWSPDLGLLFDDVRIPLG